MKPEFKKLCVLFVLKTWWIICYFVTLLFWEGYRNTSLERYNFYILQKAYYIRKANSTVKHPASYKPNQQINGKEELDKEKTFCSGIIFEKAYLPSQLFIVPVYECIVKHTLKQRPRKEHLKMLPYHVSAIKFTVIPS